MKREQTYRPVAPFMRQTVGVTFVGMLIVVGLAAFYASTHHVLAVSFYGTIRSSRFMGAGVARLRH